MSDDYFVFADEDNIPVDEYKEVWEILIVDDDQDVHDATLYALDGYEVFGRTLLFHHAYSAADAITMLKQHPHIAIILLDAVMETDSAGLDAVRVIREDLGREDVRIILRTGQPGHVPELETITKYDINDYKTKSELTRSKLITTITTAIRSWEQLRRIQNSREGLEKIVLASNQFIAEQGLNAFAEGVISQMASLFNLSPEGIVCASGILPGMLQEPYSGEGSKEHWVIIAAAGDYSRFIHCNISQIDDSKIVKSIRKAMTDQKTVLEKDSITVFFKEAGGRMYSVYIASPRPLKDVDRHLLEVFCTNIALSASNIELVNRLKKQAWEDQVLRIPNMAALLGEIEERIKVSQENPSILALFDIVSFSEINDLLGHDYGNEILKAVVDRFKQIFTSRVYLSRISADIFGLVGPESELNQEALIQLNTIEIVTAEGRRNITFSIGATYLSIHQGDGSNQLHNALFSLKKSKEHRQVIFYSHDIGIFVREKNQLLHDLRQAILTEQVYLVYQPQACIGSDHVYSFEALIRWRKPNGDIIPPSQFIPLAEQSGLIIKLGEWILRQSLEDLNRIHDAGYPDMKMAVNVSAVQFKHPDFLDVLDKVIASTHIDPTCIELEITESVSLLAIDHVLSILKEIRNRGISIAIDDFGTGYSSLATIDRWPINRIKIDRSFIQKLNTDEDGTRIVDLVIPLGKKLSVKILAEGVETKDQLDRLNELECSEVQGFYLSKPLVLKDLLVWLDNRK
ncbi:bifunctional diguanylate cyclase/phosphodiesterase [Spirochaeta cellobiosiphila]|uniref:bifunctional diguanylate cyclase/phosphodiesterase n=1 Tax=Spirochaeta cellobiosiphila TaxID=504483 RepID=UPI00042A5B49|nr:EAL domain-containing protein [Spirochaeta cellobiosiphila]